LSALPKPRGFDITRQRHEQGGFNPDHAIGPWFLPDAGKDNQAQVIEMLIATELEQNSGSSYI